MTNAECEAWQEGCSEGDGFELPDDLFAFHEFARSNAKLLGEVEIRTEGPLDVLSDDTAKSAYRPLPGSRKGLGIRGTWG